MLEISIFFGVGEPRVVGGKVSRSFKLFNDFSVRVLTLRLYRRLDARDFLFISSDDVAVRNDEAVNRKIKIDLKNSIVLANLKQPRENDSKVKEISLYIYPE